MTDELSKMLITVSRYRIYLMKYLNISKTELLKILAERMNLTENEVHLKDIKDLNKCSKILNELKTWKCELTGVRRLKPGNPRDLAKKDMGVYKMKVVEIFNSIDGEGKRTGELTTFIRLYGCNLRCGFCFGENQNGKYPEVTLPNLTKKPLNEVNIGDTILTMVDGIIKETIVTDINKRQVDNFNKLQLSNTSFIVTPEHPFRIGNEWKEVKDIKVGDKVINATNQEYSKYILDCYKDDLLNYTIQTLDQLVILYERYRKANSGSNNGNYNPNRYNYERLKDAIKKGICTQDIITGEYCGSLVVHHLDGNHDNDSINNLVIISRKLHDQIHTRGKSFWNKANKVIPFSGLPIISNTNNKNTKQLGYNTIKNVIGITCEPYNTYLINDILVHNCDTKYSYNQESEELPYKEMSIEEIIKECDKYNTDNITLTGGEPLIHLDVKYLLRILSESGYNVNVETNGSVSIKQYYNEDGTHAQGYENVWFTVDYKSPSSGMQDKMLMDNFDVMKYKYQDVVYKFVVGNEKDLDVANDIINTKILTNMNRNNLVYISPIFGDIEPKAIVEYMQKHDLFDSKTPIRCQIQLHKVLWPIDQRGV